MNGSIRQRSTTWRSWCRRRPWPAARRPRPTWPPCATCSPPRAPSAKSCTRPSTSSPTPACGEALGLTWDNVHLDMKRIYVVGSLVRTAQRGLILEPPKTSAGLRTVDIDDGTALVLGSHHEDQGCLKRQVRQAYRDEGRVFAGPTGEWVNPMRLTRAVRRLGELAGHPGMTLRSLRHFHASVTLQTGQNIVVVSKRLGHSNVSITSDIYAHSLPGWQRQAAAAFAAAMDKGDEQRKELA